MKVYYCLKNIYQSLTQLVGKKFKILPVPLVCFCLANPEEHCRTQLNCLVLCNPATNRFNIQICCT